MILQSVNLVLMSPLVIGRMEHLIYLMQVGVILVYGVLYALLRVSCLFAVMGLKCLYI